MKLDLKKIEEDAAYREDLQHRFNTDHFFAAEVMGFTDFREDAHRPAVDLYFPKNKNKAMRNQHKVHKRIHLDPRHSFKSTLKRVDRMQWLTAFDEEVTILIETATQKLAPALSIATTRYFYRPKKAPATLFQAIFPHLVVGYSPKSQFNTPTRKFGGPGDTDASLDVTSVQSSQSGWHPFVKEPDDVEDTDNSGLTATQTSRDAVTARCEQNENLLRDGGFINITGTRYHPFDYYGKCLDLAEQSPELWKTLVRGSLITKNNKRLEPGEFPNEEDVEIVFPGFANLSYAELRSKFYANYESFMCQQQNDPQGGHVPTFDERIFESVQIAPERIPSFHGETYMVWRLPHSGLPAAGAAARVVDNKVYILDAWEGTYIPSNLAEKIVDIHRKLHTKGVLILQTPGSEFMWANIRNVAAQKNIGIPLQTADWYEDPDMRHADIIKMEPLMKVGRIWFSTATSKAAELRKQFVHYGLVEETGIIECISKLADLVPMSQMRATLLDDEIESQTRAKENMQLEGLLHMQGMLKVDEQKKMKARAHLRSLTKITTFRMPGLPGGLDG